MIKYHESAFDIRTYDNIDYLYLKSYMYLTSSGYLSGYIFTYTFPSPGIYEITSTVTMHIK